MEISLTSLEYGVEYIESELREKSPVTNLRRSYLAKLQFMKTKNLEDVCRFTEDSIVKADQENGLIRKDADSRPKEVTNDFSLIVEQ